MRPSLTIALLLIASIGAQAADAGQPASDSVAPRLLAALMDQPSGIAPASQLVLHQPTHQLCSGLVWQTAASQPAVAQSLVATALVAPGQSGSPPSCITGPVSPHVSRGP